MNKQTKAERIFQVTYAQCKRHMEVWGKEYNPNGRPVSFNSVCCNDNEGVSIRTLNDIQKLIDNRKRMNEMNNRFDIYTEIEVFDKAYILEAVQVAVNNTRKSLEAFAVELKEL